MAKPLLLDGFCKAGGAGMGYHRAGFEVVGVDVEPQRNYPFEFVQADFFEFVAEHGREFDAIHASPPCQAHSQMRHLSWLRGREWVNLIPATRDALRSAAVPYVIENVEGARRWMQSPIKLCGSSFGLDVRRHRLFESNMLLFPAPCNHDSQEARFPPSGPTRQNPMRVIVVVGGGMQKGIGVADFRRAMDIDWMTGKELSQAIPPAYTEHIGTQLLWHLEGVA